MLPIKYKMANRVLIETYWNVKVVWERKTISGTSINRNILECKEETYGTMLYQEQTY